MKSPARTTGLRHWMTRVLEECDHVAADFSADPVHDLRVALRRCRSLADGMIAIDPDPEWKAMKKAGKRLFQRLGDLRDVQIMMEWIEKLDIAPLAPEAGPAQLVQVATEISPAPQPESLQFETPQIPAYDPVRHALLEILKNRETGHKREARAALEEFNQKEWKQWSKSLPHRTARVRPGSAVFKHLALERWTAARDLHRSAMRNRSQVALHTLRIGIKRFRYIVENFLPEEHKAWSSNLKHMQDLLGEVHDLDVLWSTALGCRVFPDEAARGHWHERILEERRKRVDEYREKTTGPESLWNVWRAGLPQGEQVREFAMRRMKLWAKALDPDFAHSERVARLSLELYDGLSAVGLGAVGLGAVGLGTEPGDEARGSLYLAAVLHDVGKVNGNRKHHKLSLELIEKHGTPLGWSEQEMRRAAVVARFHSGTLPTRSHKNLRDLLPDEQKTVIRLAAILRLANAFDAGHDGHIRRVKIENAATRNRKRRPDGFRSKSTIPKDEAVVIAAEGYVPGSSTARQIAAERYLLETVLRRPIMVKTAESRRPLAVVRLAS